MTSSHQVPIVADMLFEDLKEEEVEMIVLPGGLPGATNLDAHAGLDKLIMSFAAAGNRWLPSVPHRWFMASVVC